MKGKLKEEWELNKFQDKNLIDTIRQLEEEQTQINYALSHDIKESIRNINSFLELIHLKYEGRLDHGMVNYLTLITSTARRMEGLVNDISDFKLIGKDFNLKEVDTGELVKSVMKELSIEISYCCAKFDLGTLPTLQCDERSMRLLFKVLINNALKFRNKDRSPHIVMSSSIHDGMMQFSIKDNGIGIDPKFDQVIFDFFRQLHPRGAYAGNGVGLAMAQKVMRLHGGKIWLETSNSKNTEFKFKLPMYD